MKRTRHSIFLLSTSLFAAVLVSLIAGCKTKDSANRASETVSAYAKEFGASAGRLTSKAGEKLGLVEKKWDFVRFAWDAQEKPAAVAHNYSYEDERDLGLALALEFFARQERFEHERLDPYLNLVASALAAHSDRPAMEVRVAVLRGESLHAFGLPGGLILVPLGALRACESESELAGLLAQAVAQCELRLTLARLEHFAAERHAEAKEKSCVSLPPEQLRAVLEDLALDLSRNGLKAEDARVADRRSVDLLMRLGYEPGGLRAHLARAQLKLREKAGGGPLANYAEFKAREETIDARLAELHAPSLGRSIADRYRREGLVHLPAPKL